MKIAEKERIERMLALGCVACVAEARREMGWELAIPEVHHIVDGNRRLGHWFTLPLCPGHHRGVWTPAQLAYWTELAVTGRSISAGRKPFNLRYGTEEVLWTSIQMVLGLSVEWPQSKIAQRAG